MTEAMPFLQKYDITFLRPPTILGRASFMISAPLYFSPVLFWTKGSYSCGSKTHKGDGVLWITAKQSAPRPGRANPFFT